MLKTFAFAVLLSSALLLAPAADATTPQAAPLTAAQKEDLDRVRRYLTELDTVKARFLQTATSGSIAEGTLYLDRPGRMRFEYDPPIPVEIVADGTWLIYHDRELKQVSRMLISATPADMLLRPQISLADDVTVIDYEKELGVMRITLVETKEPEAGALTLFLTDKPLALRKWSVTDPQGIVTTITLMEPRFGLPFGEELFEFKDPHYDQQQQAF